MSKSKNKKGFTLIELMVSISIFSIVMLISMGSILAVLDANRKSQAMRAVMDNISSTLEGMTRTIRFGDTYHCGTATQFTPLTEPRDCPFGDTSLAIQSADGSQVTYFLDYSNNKIVKTVSGSIDSDGDYDLTSPNNVTIENLTFYVRGASIGDNLQPKVLIVIKGYAGTKSTKSSFSLETTLSQRKLDI